MGQQHVLIVEPQTYRHSDCVTTVTRFCLDQRVSFGQETDGSDCVGLGAVRPA